MHGVNLSGPVRSQLDVDRLAAWMRKHVAGFPSHAARIEVQQFVHGQSNPTFLVAADRLQFVVRKKPEGKLLAGAHQIEREYRVISALHGRGVPVPLPLGLCTDTSVIGTPFFVMSFVPGRIFKDPTLPGLQPAERFAIFSELVRVLAVLHSVDFKAAGLSDFGKHSDYCGRQKSLWSKQYSQVAADIAKHPGQHHHVLAPSAKADTHMHSLIKYLDAAVPSVVDECCLTHGDYRLDNVIFHPTEPRIVAVLDWELATLGHPLSDLAYLCQVFHNPSSGLHTPQSRDAAAAFASKHGATNTVAPYIGIADINAKRRATLGLPDEPELLRAYMRCTMRPAPISQWRTHLALSYFRAAAILHGVWARARAGNNASAIGGAVGSLYGEVAAVGMRIVEAERASPNQPPTAHPMDSPVYQVQPAALSSFAFSARFWSLRAKLLYFMDAYVFPAEGAARAEVAANRAAGNAWKPLESVEQLKERAKELGLWNLFLPSRPDTGGLSNLEYAPLCEIMGRSLYLAPEALNCSAPDTGNMEVLARYGNKAQQERWLAPLLRGEIRSCFGMTEPGVASSDATNIECSVSTSASSPDEYVINGRKWWTSGAMDPRCKVMILLARTDLAGTQPKHKKLSMLLVPMDAPGVTIERHLTVYGYDHAPHGHAVVRLVDVRVKKHEAMLLGEGRGFEIAQGRLGPGRIHHCMRLIGQAERALEMHVRRVLTRTAFGGTLATKGAQLKDIADSRIEIDSARQLVLQAASSMDKYGNKVAAQQIAMIKVSAPLVALRVIDRAVQAHGAMGVCDDLLLADAWANARTLRLADGPDEVHRETVAKIELLRSKL